MPVIPQISQSIKISKAVSGGLPPEPISVIDGTTQASLSLPSLQPVPFPPFTTPIIPFGMAIGMILTKLEALLFQAFEDLNSIRQKTMDKYNNDRSKALIQRDNSENKLYYDIIESQKKIKEDVKKIEQEIDDTTIKIKELEEEQKIEKTKYDKIVFGISKKAKDLEESGDIEESKKVRDTIKNHDDWLSDIIKMTIEITQLKLLKTRKEKELQQKRVLADMNIIKNWDDNTKQATSFNVAIPFRMDLPELPSLPPLVPVIPESEFIKALRKSFGKWIVTPTILPFGISLSAILLFVQSQAPAIPPLASKLESDADGAILQGGGAL